MFNNSDGWILYQCYHNKITKKKKNENTTEFLLPNVGFALFVTL